MATFGLLTAAARVLFGATLGKQIDKQNKLTGMYDMCLCWPHVNVGVGVCGCFWFMLMCWCATYFFQL